MLRMKVAISGVTDLTKPQFTSVGMDFYCRLNPGDTVVSGAAKGVDTVGAVAAVMAEPGFPVILTVPIDQYYNVDLREIISDGDCIFVPGSYMDRNDVTADISDRLVAYPPTAAEELRSGTWATVRRFRARGKPVEIVPLNSL